MKAINGEKGTHDLKEGRRVAPRRWFLGLAAVVFVVYLPSLGADFVRWDDDILILENERLKASSFFEPASLGWVFGTDYVSQWRPLNWLSYVIQFQLFGLNPLGYHVVSVLLHVSCALVLFLILNRIYYEQVKTIPAFGFLVFLCTLGWAIHPQRVEAVAWIAAQGHLQAGFFSLLAFLCYVNARERSALMPAPLILSWFFFSVGLLFYPVAVGFPLLVFGLEALGTDLDRVDVSGFRRRFHLALLRSIPFGLLAAAVVSIQVSNPTNETVHYASMTRISLGLETIWTSLLIFGSFLLKAVYPVGLTAFYTPVDQFAVFSTGFWLPLIVLMSFLLVGFAWKGFLVSLFMSFLISLPFLGLSGAPPIPSDRYFYLGSAFLIGGIGFVAKRVGPPRKICGIFALTLVPLVLTNITYQSSWGSTRALMLRMLEVNPDHYARWLFFDNLAEDALSKNQFEDAVKFLNAGIELMPSRPKWYRLRSYALLGLDRWEEARRDYEKWLTMAGEELE